MSDDKSPTSVARPQVARRATSNNFGFEKQRRTKIKRSSSQDPLDPANGVERPGDRLVPSLPNVDEDNVSSSSDSDSDREMNSSKSPRKPSRSKSPSGKKKEAENGGKLRVEKLNVDSNWPGKSKQIVRNPGSAEDISSAKESKSPRSSSGSAIPPHNHKSTDSSQPSKRPKLPALDIPSLPSKSKKSSSSSSTKDKDKSKDKGSGEKKDKTKSDQKGKDKDKDKDKNGKTPRSARKPKTPRAGDGSAADASAPASSDLASPPSSKAEASSQPVTASAENLAAVSFVSHFLLAFAGDSLTVYPSLL